ncbi:four helix bundle protein [Halanaerobacter jeridensis]|uniref:Four helix bundle protein n=1 Tax=Halanaerobacter jeridensis TaxID=706427 RepID=A0A939BR68_9FIRM|nr:four helix bundle protein [Halanaerobacter jeridensis]MBM7557064.1 four helix bundle protein [Halanaerobacter jeridensis]
MKNHKELVVWQKAVDLVKIIYELTGDFPKSEEYGLSNQLRRAAVSVPSNIAEGAGRRSKKDFVWFLDIAMGSLSELETQLIIAKKLDYIDDIKSDKLVEIKKMLLGLIKAVKSS